MEALMNRKSEFVRTPKFRIQQKEDSLSKNKYFMNMKIESSAYIEMILAFYCLIGVVASIYFMEIAALPFQLMFFFGFGSVSYFSFRNSFTKRQKAAA
jgi:hypothetical protein